MKTDYYQETFLLQTFIELDCQISDLARLIGGNRYLEIGDDPNLVRKIENTLTQVYSKIKTVAPYFDLSVISLRKANYYFDLIKQVDDTVAYLQEIKKRDYGSRQHTKELLEKLENCSNSIFAISDLMSINSEVVH